MNQGLLALFVRSLREENRRVSTYVVRFVLIVFVLLMVAFNHQAFRFGGGAPGLRVFQAVTNLNLLFITVIGLGYFASAITEEKEDGTLGLLRMTNLSPLSILLGKSTSRLIGFLLLIVAQVPFIMLAVALGGVGPKQIFGCYLILGSFTFLLANLSLVFSVMFRRTPVAVACTLGVLVFVFGGIAFLGRFFQEAVGSDLGLASLGRLIWQGNPINGLFQVFSLGSTGAQFIQPISNIVAGIVCFLLSWLIFDRFNQGEGRGASPAASRRRKVAVTRTPTALGDKPRPQGMAVTWREFYFEGGGVKRLWLSFFILIVISIVIIIVGTTMSIRPPRAEDIGGTFMTIGLLSAVVRWALEMGSVFKHERVNQTWSALALLPKSIRRLAYEKVFASLIVTLPGLLVGAFGFMFVADEILPNFNRGSNLEEFFMIIMLCVAWFFFASHLIVYLSLYLKWGAFPIGIVACVMLQMIMGIIAALSQVTSMEGTVTLWSFGLFVGSFLLHVLIGKRLAVLASQD